MPTETIKQILMRRDSLSAEDADNLIAEAREDFYAQLEHGIPDESQICMDWFGLEPDYIMELI